MEILRALKPKEDSLAEQIHKELRGDILTGKIPAGTRLVESNIAETLNVSRTPVREALRQLVIEGFLNAIPRAGYVVEVLSEHDIRDLFETRTAIEQAAGRAALKHLTTEELALMESNLQKTQALIDGGTTENMIDLDMDFHDIIYRATRSRYLYTICRSLSDHTLKFRIAVIPIPEIARRGKEGHAQIYEALQNREVTKVEETIASHLNVVQEDVLNHLKNLREKSFLR